MIYVAENMGLVSNSFECTKRLENKYTMRECFTAHGILNPKYKIVRNEKEIEQAHECRKTVESLINWDCEVVKNYAEENRGVYRNIGEGAKWVFEREEKAIFLEDDNLPETSFFRYADEMLEKYETAPEVLWICGTNYVTDMNGKESYAFTQHLLPCGWASWSTKFLKYYDGELSTFRDEAHKRKFYSSYSNRWLAQWQYQSVRNEVERHERTGRFISWDYQMLWSVRSNGLYGVVPLRNQITNAPHRRS